MNQARRIFFVAGILLANVGWLLAGQPQQEAIWFVRQVFFLADFNGDGQLTRAETSQLIEQWGYFRQDAGFNLSDLNKDQLLSRDEVEGAAWQAMVHRLAEDEQDLKRLISQYQHLGNAESEYLERHPGLSARLLANVVWTRENPTLIKKLLRNRAWLRENPEVADALQNNLVFWAEHPTLARQYYLRPPAGRNAALYEAWRSLHQQHLENHPELNADFRLEFPYRTAVSSSQPSTAKPAEAAVSVSEQQAVKRLAPAADQQQKIDSLLLALSEAKGRIQRLETVITALGTQQGTNSLPSASADAESLQRELRVLQIEQKLARLEEDSLLATTLRQKKHIAFLQAQLVQDSVRMSRPGQETLAENKLMEDELVQLKTFIQSQTAELDSLNSALRIQQEMLNQEQRKLAALTQSQAQSQTQVSFAFDSLQQQVSQANIRLENQKIDLQTLSWHRDLLRLQNDSLRLVIVQSGLRRQALLDSLADLRLFAWQQSDSLANFAALRIHAGASEREDSLVQLLRQAERSRLQADRAWQAQLDSLSSQLMQSGETLAYRAADDPDMQRVALAASQRSEASLRYDNQKLRAQLETLSMFTQQQEAVLRQQLQAVLKNNRRLEYQNRKLQQRVESRRLPTSTVAIERMDEANFELTEARTRLSEMERINETLLIQLQASQAYILQRMRQEEETSDQLRDEMTTAQAARFQADTMSLALARALRSNLPDTVLSLKGKIRQMEDQQKSLETRAVEARVTYLQQRDSLTQVIDQRDLELIRLRQNTQVEGDRFARIAAKEQELVQQERRLQEKQQLLDQREIVIQAKTLALEEKEKKYLQLEAWEADLKRREQRLRVQGGN